MSSSRPAATQGNYDLVVALFCAFLLISNIAATKLISFGRIIADGGAFLFPLTYILGDLLAEVYGFRKARRAIWTGFVCSITASITFLLVGAAPPAPAWPNQAAFDAVLGFVPRIVAASLTAYLLGQMLNAWVLVKMKKRTGQKALWARLIGSTAVAELADTTIFCLIAFGGLIPAHDMANYILVGYLYKTCLEILLLPITYRVIAWVRAREPE